MIIGGYTITDKIDSGGYGKVYRGYENLTLKPVAVKISIKCGHKVSKEAKILKKLSGGIGIPEVYTHGKWNHVHFMVLELLGHNLYREMLENKQGFSLSCVIKIAEQMIERLKFIHSKGILHRDIKPEQLLLSMSGDEIYLVDYGLSCKYIRKKAHKTFKDHVCTVGSVYFASLHSHLGHEQSRRDDLESLFYTLLFLKNAHIPWEGAVQGLEGISKWQACFVSKISHQQDLFHDWPIQFSNMFNYIRKLVYEENPNYDYFIKCFEEIKDKMGLKNEFDWTICKSLKAVTLDIHNQKKNRQNRSGRTKDCDSIEYKEKKLKKDSRKTHSPMRGKIKPKQGKEEFLKTRKNDNGVQSYLDCQKTDKAELPQLLDKRILDLAKSKKFHNLIVDHSTCIIS